MSQASQDIAPMSPTETFKRAPKHGSHRNKIAPDMKRLAEAAVARHGHDVATQFPSGFWISHENKIRLMDEAGWSGETVALFALAEATESLHWGQQNLARFVESVREDPHHEIPASVEQVVGNLASLRGSTVRLSYNEIGERLRAKAKRGSGKSV